MYENNMIKINIILVCLFLFSNLIDAQYLTPVTDSIPTRDGKKLAADIYIPSTGQQYPVILIQTPYNRLYYRWGLPLGTGINLQSSNYAFVIVDWRCFYGSASACITNPKRGEDGYDVVEWIASQSWSNGKVGTWGPSALGKVQYQTAKENPPHLVCSVPLVAGTQFDYLEYFPGGVYRTEYVQQLDNLGFGLSSFLLANPVFSPTWQYVENANWYPASIRVPVLMIGGWYDHNVTQMLELFQGLRTSSPTSVRDKHRLLMGPWAHGGFGAAQVGSEQQGELFYTNATGYSDTLAMKFFNFYLRDIANGWDQTEFVTYYQMGDNLWNTTASWPTSEISLQRLYFHNDNVLRTDIPTQASGQLSLTYDPRDPSPTVGGPTLRQDLDQGPYDQAPVVESRNDILVFSTDVLQQDVVMKGAAIVHLYASSDRKDTDFSVRLTDVYPDGRSMLLADGIKRLRFRNGYTAADTSVAVPGNIYQIIIDLPATSITFPAGHKIRVDITSSNYPRFDKNLNNGGTMYTTGDTLIAQSIIYTSQANASYIELPVDVLPLEISESVKNKNNITANFYDKKLYVNITKNVKNYSFEMYDLTGRKIFIERLNNIGEHNVIDLSGFGFSQGIYLLKIQAENNSVSLKINL